MQTSTISLFPLSLVVFHGSKYPLHIFEERYKKMVHRCLVNVERFGITAQIGNSLSAVGSYVRIVKVLKEYDNGESDIVVQGLSRFILVKYQPHPDGYYEAEINGYDDISNTLVDDDSLNDLKEKLKKIMDKVNFKLNISFWENYLQFPSKSFKIAEKSGLSLVQQQKLLSLQDENERIGFLLEHLDSIEKKIDRGKTVKEITLGDGYIDNL